MSGFDGKVAVITGAGGGLGRCHALEFAKRGARLVINDLGSAVDGSGQGDAADAVVAEIKALGGEAIANKASVADRAGAASIIEDAIRSFGTVDILVNNAGILRDKTFRKMSLDDFETVLDVHLMGTVNVTHAAWPIMYEKSHGRIVFTSSGSGIYGNYGQSNYGAAKMAMLGLMNVLALEGAPRNIHVNCLAPGAATRMTNTVPGRDDNVDEPPAERHPALVSPAVLYLCSEDAPNGVTINAAGGRFSRAEVFVGRSINLGTAATYEELAAQAESLLDMSDAQPRRRRANG